MNTIVIDSGSTKSDVAVIGKNGVEYYTQQGINPQIQKETPISDRLANDLAHAERIVFYGAGCDTENDVKVLTNKFKVYNVAIEVEAYSDMLGACRATAGSNPGIVSILGTGSNSCVYDGSEIVDTIPQFGYILNDDGGGSYIGKMMLQDYFDGEMPSNIAQAFESHYDLSRAHVLYQLYKSNNTSQYLASHVAFMSLIKGKWKKKILNRAFEDFIRRRIAPYTDYNQYDLYFVGSIAHHFQKRLKKVMKNSDLKIAGIEQKPIQKLVEFQLNRSV